MANGDVFKGNFKDGMRHGNGLCQFSSGAIYRGDWREDKPHGHGTLYSGNGEILDCKFENGFVVCSGGSDLFGKAAAGKIKILFSDGSFYMGQYADHHRHGLGTMIYANGDIYDG